MTRKINFHELAKLSEVERARLLQRTETDLSSFEEKVRPIIAAVRNEGDEALARFAREFDKATVIASEIAATEADFAAAEKSLEPQVRAAMEFAARGDVASRDQPRCLWW
jgi:histidinol dehydrogenase